VFYIKTDDDLIPFELEAFPDRTFFRNAGSTTRSGLELTYQRQLSEQLSLNTSYSFSDFRYDSYSLPSGDFSGNALPVIPKHKAYASLVYQNEKLTAQLESNYVGSLYANDANSVTVNDYTVVNLNVGYTIGLKGQSLKPFLGIQNLLDTKYNDNIRINAFGGRYYEAAPRLHVFGGVRLLF